MVNNDVIEKNGINAVSELSLELDDAHNKSKVEPLQWSTKSIQ